MAAAKWSIIKLADCQEIGKSGLISKNNKYDVSITTYYTHLALENNLAKLLFEIILKQNTFSVSCQLFCSHEELI